MAIGKSTKKAGKKGQKKKVVDPLSRKEWFQLRAPAPFKAESFGYTLANRTMGLKKVEDSIKGRVVEAVQPDLAPPGNDGFAWRKIKLVVDDTRGRDALTSLYGVDMTRDQFCALIKKRKTLIEGVVDVKSQDGYVVRVFSVCFTKETPGQKKKTNYAMSSQQKQIRRKMNEIISREISKANGNQILTLFTSEVVEKKITKEVSRIYPVKNVRVRKIKVIQRPKIDSTKLADMHDNDKRILTKTDGKKAIRGDKKKKADDNEATNLLSRE